MHLRGAGAAAFVPAAPARVVGSGSGRRRELCAARVKGEPQLRSQHMHLHVRRAQLGVHGQQRPVHHQWSRGARREGASPVTRGCAAETGAEQDAGVHATGKAEAEAEAGAAVEGKADAAAEPAAHAAVDGDNRSQSSSHEAVVADPALRAPAPGKGGPLEPGVDSSGAGGGERGGGAGGRGDGSGGDGKGAAGHIALVASRVPDDLVKKLLQRLKDFMRVLGNAMNKVFDVVPPQVLTAIIGVLSGVAAQRGKFKADQHAARQSKEEQIRRRREQLERELRKKYTSFHGPLLSAAVKLSERLYFLIEGPDEALREHLLPAQDPCPSSTYSAYLLGRYVGLVELIKRESQTLDLGFPAADRIFMNILGRIQAVMCADDDSLRRIQESERYFKLPPGQKPFPGGPLKIMPRSQIAIGELMLRSRWSDSKLPSSLRHPSGILTLLEFMSLLETDSEMQTWFKPVIAMLEKLEHRADTLHFAENHRRHRRSKSVIAARDQARVLVGARPYFLQCALQDLIDFLDPMPRTKFARPGLRRRLRFGGIHHGEEQRMPPTLRDLYSELGHARDYSADVDSVATRILKDKRVEVFVKSPDNEHANFEEPQEIGDCPYSQRVLITLEELGVKYSVTPIPLKAKPSWFHLLHPEGSVPVLYNAGCLVADSRHIVGYLLEAFPNAGRALRTHSKTKIAVGTMTFTRFYPPFLAAVSGREGALAEMQDELRKLNGFLENVQKHEEGSFLGGKRFSREDTAVIPMLHRVAVAGPAVMGPQYGIPKDCVALRRYLDAALQRKSVAKTTPSDRVVIEGYGSLRNEGRLFWLLDLLE